MRYLGLSLVFHLFFAGALVLSGLPWGNITPQVTSVVEVEWVEVPTTAAPSAHQLAPRQRPKQRASAASAPEAAPKTEDPSESAAFAESEARPQALTYAEELKSYIESNRVYPRQALKLQQSGTVMVKLQIAPTGEFRNIDILEPSPFESLNQAALHLLRNLKGFKPPPDDLKTAENFVVPIVYQIRDKRSL